MKVAIVNNGIHRPNSLIKLLGDVDIDLFEMTASIEIQTSKYDLLVLTGSNQFPITGNHDALENEFELVRSAACSVIGICYGAEIINVAFGGTLRDMGKDKKERSIIDIELTEAGKSYFTTQDTFQVYDAHRWIIDDLGTDLSIFATSHHGVEIIKHTKKQIWGLQFHPEKFTEQSDGSEIFSFIVKNLPKQPPNASPSAQL